MLFYLEITQNYTLKSLGGTCFHIIMLTKALSWIQGLRAQLLWTISRLMSRVVSWELLVLASFTGAPLLFAVWWVTQRETGTPEGRCICLCHTVPKKTQKKKQELIHQMAQHRKATASEQDSAIHLHSKETGDSFKDSQVCVLAREEDGGQRSHPRQARKHLLVFIHCLLPRLQHSPTIP